MQEQSEEYQTELEKIKREKEIQENRKKEPTKKIGRNEKCFCGSGKKFKKCCITKYSNRQPISVFKNKGK